MATHQKAKRAQAFQESWRCSNHKDPTAPSTHYNHEVFTGHGGKAGMQAKSKIHRPWASRDSDFLSKYRSRNCPLNIRRTTTLTTPPISPPPGQGERGKGKRGNTSSPSLVAPHGFMKRKQKHKVALLQRHLPNRITNTIIINFLQVKSHLTITRRIIFI